VGCAFSFLFASAPMFFVFCCSPPPFLPSPLTPVKVWQNDVEKVKELIESGTNLEDVVEDCTPLYLACLRGHTEVAEALIGEGLPLSLSLSLSLFLSSLYIIFSLSLSISLFSLSLSPFLFPFILCVFFNPPSIPGKVKVDGDSPPIFAAAGKGNLDLVNHLLKHGANPSAFSSGHAGFYSTLSFLSFSFSLSLSLSLFLSLSLSISLSLSLSLPLSL